MAHHPDFADYGNYTSHGFDWGILLGTAVSDSYKLFVAGKIVRDVHRFYYVG
ncbi:MAG: hypothetical protein H6667_07465 [Ardenticatenaceae bacterium]|nr:hypothetical protein [Ardenticatenaceae bacterium]